MKVLTTHTHRLHEGMEVSTNLLVVIILQCIHVSNHYTVHLKLTCHVNYISKKQEKHLNLTLKIMIVTLAHPTNIMYKLIRSATVRPLKNPEIPAKNSELLQLKLKINYSEIKT